ncbi:MAG: hypothetical protein HDR48_00935 [Bacteroides sp.]|nr:hypothetical protein [Bacteroides sp.]MBD5418591.1 hypothetical protein [Bacteroides sp.]
MEIFLIIVSVLLWLGALVALPKRILLAPALSYCAMLIISFAKSGGYPIVPVSNGLTISWLAISLVVMLIILLQNPAIRQQSRGVGYMTVGALAGMAVGLAGFTFSTSLQLLYAIMILATAGGIILGMLLFANTPDGRAVSPSSGNFLKYLLAKGFPILITVAQIGIVAVILIAGHLMA